MSKLLIYLMTCCFFSCLCSTDALATIDDFEDGDAIHDVAWFNTFGTGWPIPRLDSSGNYQTTTIRRVIVDHAPIETHCRDFDGTDYKHSHYSADYDDLPVIGNKVTEGDDYWDYMFQKGDRTSRNDSSHVTVVRNCFAYALDDFIEHGAYSHWMPYVAGVLQAFEADADSTLQSNVQGCDVLLYATYSGSEQPYHATEVDSIDTVAEKPDLLRWKYGTSGVYTLSRTTFETPKCDDVIEVPGQPLGGNWSWDEAGDESDLWPRNPVVNPTTKYVWTRE